MQNEEGRILEWIDSNQEEAIGFLQDLVRIPSPTGNEASGQKFIAQYLSDMGLEVEPCIADMKALEGHPEFIPVDPDMNLGSYNDRPNIIGRYHGTDDGRSIMYFAHIDTVPPNDNWTHDPFGCEIDCGRMYGLGTSDMKAGMAASFFAVKACIQAGIRLKGDVLCVSNIGEEIGDSGGILACIEQGYKTDAGIHPHPGEGKPDMVWIASSGVLSFRVKVKGSTTHGFQSHLGVNAIEKAWRIAEALQEFDRHIGINSREELTENSFYQSGRPVRAANLYLSACRGGGWLYQVPPSCEMDWVYTFPNNESIDENIQRIEDTIHAATAADPWLRANPPEIEWLPMKFSPSRSEPGHPFIKTIQGSIESVTGRKTHLGATPVGSDMRVPSLYGDMATANIGPSGGGAHGPDEWVDVKSYITAIKMFSVLLTRWCGIAT